MDGYYLCTAVVPMPTNSRHSKNRRRYGWDKVVEAGKHTIVTYNDDEDTKLWLPVDACCWLKTNCKLNFD